MTAESTQQRQWRIVGRWQEYAGERRANLLRTIAIGAFYAVQLINFYVFEDGSEGALVFHKAVTSLAVAWALVALCITLCLRNRVFPASLKFLSTACDIALLTALALASEAKANSPLVYVYFVIVLLAGLRFSLPLVWCATIGSMLAYLALVGMSDPTWFDADHAIRPVEQLIVHLSLALTGILLGQIVRHARGMAGDYAARTNVDAP